ncbi:DNA repair and recombination protein mus-11 [Diplodia seriata]|uniref:RAD52 homolog n=1 Tax=Diplodia seriata TaxID=420778 RepID=A0A1S8B775_9PEZI|nr:DNA repair and recombination protein mus-11 [Diplodia seriata]
MLAVGLVACLGDQHRGLANPFEDEKPRVSAWTAQEIATLQSRLDKQLGPEFISSRKGPNGRTLYYLPAEKAINLANEVFGFSGWSSSIRDTTIDFVDQSQSTGKVSLGLSVIIRVTLKDGTYHEDIGYGHIENCTGKAAAFEKAKKEAATDALKRALRTFGNVLGNCLYDKNYESKISKMKVAPTRWNPDNLHRHADFAPSAKTGMAPPADVDHQPAVDQNLQRQPNIQKTASNGTELEDEFGGNLFEGVDFDRDDSKDDSAYESMLVDTGSKPDPHDSAQHQPVFRTQSMPSVRPTNGVPSGPQRGPPASGRATNTTSTSTTSRTEGTMRRIQNPNPDLPQPGRTDQPVTAPLPAHAAQPNRKEGLTTPAASEAGPDSSNQAHPQQQPAHDTPVRFFTGRAADLLLKAEAANRAPAQPPPAFNPHAESPSLRRTSGIDHNTSAPVKRMVIAQANNQSGTNGNTSGPSRGGTPSAPAARTNFVNPQMDMNRRVGMPNAAPSPHANRQSYKPPVMKRPAEVQGRPALADMTNVPGDGQTDEANSKRAKMSEG